MAAAVLGWLMLAYNGVVGLLAHMLNAAINQNSSVGIIGGADGPTAIFVTSKVSVEGIVVWTILGVMGVLGWWYLSHLKKE